MADPLFRCAPVALLRAATSPLEQAGRPGPVGPNPADPVDRVRRLATDPLLTEAVAVSSQSLFDRVSALLAGELGDPADRKRAAAALTRYRLRMAGRATPFGLFAGVAAARFGEGPAKVRLGTAHRRSVRPDMGWLLAVVAELESRPEVLAGLRVAANGLGFFRGDRLVLPYLPDLRTEPGTSGGEDRLELREVTLLATPPLRTALEYATRPVAYPELVERIGQTYPQAPAELVHGLLAQLVAEGALLTDLRPELETEDPLAHVADRLPAGAESRWLREIGQGLTEYAAAPVGAGLANWLTVTERMRQLHPTDRPVQVDLALDVDALLPAEVAREAERAVDLLWRLGPSRPGTERLNRFHQEFLDRYGTGRLVDLPELLDPDIGLGAPAGYLVPAGPRPDPPSDPPEEHRDRLLAALAQETWLTGASEAVLTEDHPLVTALADRAGTPPASLELCAQLVAASTSAVDEGDFRLVLAAMPATDRAGAAVGRFLRLLDSDANRELVGFLQRVDAGPGGAIGAQVSFLPTRSRAANVCQVPRLLPYRLPLGVFGGETSDQGELHDLDPAELAVGAEPDRLYLYSRRLGREIAPATYHLLDAGGHTPNLARFLRELTASGVRTWQPWDWGAAGALPYLPRVRYGRTVLVSARWDLAGAPRPVPAGRRTETGAWQQEFTRWRRHWRVPDRVYLADGDHRLPLDLTEPGHLELLHRELAGTPGLVLVEEPAGGAGGAGWLGGHSSELVLPLRLADPGPDRTLAPVAPPRAENLPPTPYPPGGQWLRAAVYGAADRQVELLVEEVEELVERVQPDSWSFRRHQGDQPHLSLVLHGDPVELATGLTRLHDWARRLRVAGLVHRVTLEGHDPRWEQLGGPQVADAAEAAAAADSRCALEQLALLGDGVEEWLGEGAAELGPVLLAAASTVAVAVAFWGESERAARWLLAEYPKGSGQAFFRSCRPAALDWVDPYRPEDGPLLAEDLPLRAGWLARQAAARRYGQDLLELGERAWCPPEVALRTLLADGRNRLLGADGAAEFLATAVARGAVQAHLDRRRAGLTSPGRPRVPPGR